MQMTLYHTFNEFIKVNVLEESSQTKISSVMSQLTQNALITLGTWSKPFISIWNVSYTSITLHKIKNYLTPPTSPIVYDADRLLFLLIVLIEKANYTIVFIFSGVEAKFCSEEMEENEMNKRCLLKGARNIVVCSHLNLVHN